MKYARFKEIWTTLVTNRAPVPAAARKGIAPLNNGVSESTVDALIEAADGNFAQFDEIDKKLAAHKA